MGTPTKRRIKKPTISERFSRWLSARDTAETFEEEQGNLRVEILNELVKIGEEDDAGHVYYELPEPVQFTDREGRTFKYTTLKRERHLRPAQPTPDPEKALGLLQKKGLWLTAKDQKLIKDLQTRCPYAVIEVAIDADAVARAYYQDEVTEEEYESILVEQKETFQFRPAE